MACPHSVRALYRWTLGRAVVVVERCAACHVNARSPDMRHAVWVPHAECDDVESLPLDPWHGRVDPSSGEAHGQTKLF